MRRYIATNLQQKGQLQRVFHFFLRQKAQMWCYIPVFLSERDKNSVF
jgi:hypothetical protein